MVDSLHSLRSTSFMNIRCRRRTHVALRGLGANRCGSLESVYPLWPIAPSQHAAVKSVHPKPFPPGQESAMRKTTDNKNNILACNDNHIVHHFITICSFFLTKDYLVVLGRSRWVDGTKVSQGGTCGEVECSVAFVAPTSMVSKFLRFTAGACSTAKTTWSCS